MVELPPPPFREHKQIWSENNEMKLKIEVFEGLGFSRIDGGLRFFFSDPPPPNKKKQKHDATCLPESWETNCPFFFYSLLSIHITCVRYLTKNKHASIAESGPWKLYLLLEIVNFKDMLGSRGSRVVWTPHTNIVFILWTWANI